MANSFGPFKKYRDSMYQGSRTSFDSGSGNEASDKALLEKEDDCGSERSLHRQKYRNVLKIFGFTIFAVLCGLTLVLLTWRLTTLNAKCNCPAVQETKASKADASQPTPETLKIPEPMEATADTDDAAIEHESGITADMFMFKDWKDCGKTADEARSKGCRFDLMLSSWVHEDCFDEKLMERYLLVGNYTWYRDYDLLEPIPDEEIRRGDHHISYSSAQQHNAHCGYMWEVQMKAWMKGRPIPRALFSYPHTFHCAGWLVTRPPSNNTLLVTDFDKCGMPRRAV
ncbi:hypothetical protein K4F52_008590 [Lecanicillium sp. MT-2017a]|nr:hypothetical protein K4F52_008590 [Lecanicillium sp. MT-2017a]